MWCYPSFAYILHLVFWLQLIFGDQADPFRPTHITNGASPVWGGNASDPCQECGHCSHCKVASTARGDAVDVDWTYTLVRPIAQ